jgi:hypothetical protein
LEKKMFYRLLKKLGLQRKETAAPEFKPVSEIVEGFVFDTGWQKMRLRELFRNAAEELFWIVPGTIRLPGDTHPDLSKTQQQIETHAKVWSVNERVESFTGDDAWKNANAERAVLAPSINQYEHSGTAVELDFPEPFLSVTSADFQKVRRAMETTPLINPRAFGYLAVEGGKPQSEKSSRRFVAVGVVYHLSVNNWRDAIALDVKHARNDCVVPSHPNLVATHIVPPGPVAALLRQPPDARGRAPARNLG